ncbi:MAG: HEAT repeat domain-containing protein [Planctomycetes bacterium]|nr:HEAT repeat domain-containing protein [Planctomycetota bacterium]
MKVHFCDLCNESVPQADLDQGRAVVLKGRIVCVSCDRAMSQAGGRGSPGMLATAIAAPAAAPHAHTSLSAPAAPERPAIVTAPEERAPANPSPAAEAPRSTASLAPPVPPVTAAPASNTGLWVAVVGLVFTAGAIFVLDQRLEKLGGADRGLATRLEGQEKSLATITTQSKTLQDDLALAQQTFRRDLGFERDRVQQELTKLDATIKNARSELASVLTAIDALKQETSSGQSSWAQRIDDISKRVAKQEDDVRAQAEKLAEVEELAMNPPVAPVAVPAAAPAEPQVAAWRALLPDLANANSGLRWQAVDGLGQSGDPETIPHLLPMLKDADVFVRMAAARVLGNLNADPAVEVVDPSVGALIDALEDADSPVREAALVALHQITGRDFQFDPQGNEGDRGRKLKAIRDWWKRTTEAGGYKRGSAAGN